MQTETAPARRARRTRDAEPTAADVQPAQAAEPITEPVQAATPARRGRRTSKQASEVQVSEVTGPLQAQPEVTEAVQPEPEQPVAPARRGRKPKAAVAAPGAQPEVAASAEVVEASDVAVQPEPTPEPEIAVPTPRRGRKPKAAVQVEAVVAPVAVQMEDAQVDAVPAEAVLPEPEQTTTEPAQPPVTKAKRGRRAAVTPVPEAAPSEPEVVSVAVPVDETPVEPAPAARRGRKPGRARKDETVTAEVAAGPVETTPETVAETPAQQQAPTEEPRLTRRGGRKPRTTAPDVVAEQAGTGAQAEPAVTPDTLATVQETQDATPEQGEQDEPVAPRGRRNRGRGSVKVTVQAQDAGTPAGPLTDERQDDGEQDDATDGDATAAADAHPAQTLVIEQLRKLGRPVHIRDFERSFTRQGRERLGTYRSDLTALMDELVHAGLVIQTRKRTYGLPEAMNLVRGRFQASASGFGFVIPDSGGDDYYIPEGRTMEAWNGDTVLIRPEGRGGRRGDSPAGVVVRVVERASAQLVGSLEHSHGYAFLKPDDMRNKHRIMLVPEGLEGLPDGARLVTELYWPEDTGEDEVYGQVLKVLGNEDDPVTETQAVVIKYGLRDEFPPEVLEEAEAIPSSIPESALFGRLDLRDYNIFTVDGRDAKDFDDAIHIQPTPEGNFVVGVHIADVSHYVKAGQPLDDEAYARATSVYLPGQVLPMLPEHLSNGVCSLVPYEDRLTLSALIELNIDGDILDVKLAPSVIRSKARLTYDEVQAYSEAVATLQGDARALEGDLHLLLKITSRLRQRRLREGALDFKMREVKVDVGKGGHLELVPVREETARGMIEDLMLLANKVVARHLLERNVPALYRIHEEPTLARFQEVSSAIGRLGLAFPGGEPTPQAYQAVLKKVRGTPQETAVNTLLLRSMQQAKYAGENLGHFGLAFDEYLHFTSPIRRYPDLLVHRMLKASLSGELSDRQKAEMEARLAEMGRHTSERERTASEAERDLTKYYQAKWAQENLDGVFEGYVSGVIASGLFVALENGVEGRIHISNLDDDYYLYIEDAGIMKGKTTGRVFRVGEHITIRITQVNPLARQIEFSQESNMDGNEGKPRARRREERETSKREKLSTLVPSVRAPRAAQDDTQPAQAAQNRGGNRNELRIGRGRDGGSRPSSNYSGGGKRRIVTLDRPRNEHLRPVNVTVQRMYFGDWTLENMPPEDGQGGHNRSGGFRGRPQPQTARSGNERGGNRGGNGNGGNFRNQNQGQDGRAPRQQAAAPAHGSAPATAEGADGSDASKRRRRRRGRRGGNGSSQS
uniref:ribonuclease R n=1 Tax=Deinococcus aquiradiocola TaxID=393059 RepID=UPI001E5877A9|nr:ribonuclease R [Deinococcus aquiradiocola]